MSVEIKKEALEALLTKGVKEISNGYHDSESFVIHTEDDVIVKVEISREDEDWNVLPEYAEAKQVSKEWAEADAIGGFVNSMIGALESGFISDNKMTLAQLHRVAQNHVKDNCGIDLPNIVDQWGEETAKACGYTGSDSKSDAA